MIRRRPYRHAIRRRLSGLRPRVIASVVLLLTFSTMLSTVALRQVLLARVGERVEAGLRQEVTEFRQFSEQARDPRTNRRVGDDVRRLLDLFLARDVPDQGEATFTFVGDRPYRSNADLSASRQLLDRVQALGDVRSVTPGDVSTPAGRIRYLAVPIIAGGQRRGTFVTTGNLGHEQGEVDDAVDLAAGVGLAVLLIACVLGFLSAGRMLAPLRDLTDTARAIGESDLSRRIETHGHDEIATLGRTFNAMLDRLGEAFARQREFLSDAGHELRTPITIVRGHLELLENDPVERRQTLLLVTDELDRMSRFVDDLLFLARAERREFLQLGPVDLDTLTEDLFAKASALAPREWRLREAGVGVVDADRQRLTQAVMNLAANAVQHTAASGPIELGSALCDGHARLWVSDHGPGIAAVDRVRIFDRFARGDTTPREEVGSTGLGLAIVRAIAEAHDGHVEVESTPGAGSTFTIVIPTQRP